MLKSHNNTSRLSVPNDVTATIFRYTPSRDTSDLLRSGLFPQEQTNSAMLQAQMLEREKVKSFIEKLQSEWAAAYPDQMAQLSSVFKKYDNEKTIAASFNSVFSMRDKIVEIFASVVTRENVLQIEKKWHEERVKIVYSENNNDRYSREPAAILPRGFETFFNRLLTAVDIHNIEVANNLSFLQKSEALQSIVEALIKTGQRERAMEVTERIPYESMKSKALQSIVEDLIKTGQCERAMEVAERIPDKSMKSKALQSIVEDLIKTGQCERAMEVAERIPYESMKNMALQSIVEALIMAEQIERAMKVAAKNSL